AASPHAFTSAGSAWVARPGRSATRRWRTYRSAGRVSRTAAVAAPTIAKRSAAATAARTSVRRRARRLADDEPRRQLDAKRVDALALEDPDQQRDPHPPELGKRLADGGQTRRDDKRLLGVVEPDDGDVLRHGEAALAYSVERADRDVVVEPEDRGRRVREREEL